MNSVTKSLLNELISGPDFRDDENVILENRGLRVIDMAIRLLEKIQEDYGNEVSDLIEKKLLSSIHRRNNGKFVKSIQNVNKTPKV